MEVTAMPKTGDQKVKLLILMELLRQESDEGHPLRTNQILSYLDEKGISCDRRTLARDIADLNEHGFEVMHCMCGHEKGYYVDDRSFSIPELRILIDAVQSASFLTETKTAQLTRKLALLGGTHHATLLQRNTIPSGLRKHSNETIYYTIDTIEDAIRRDQQLSFLYFDLDEDCQRIYRHDRKRYTVEPVSLVLTNDRYYLAAISPDREGVSTYRIDRMDRTQREELPISLAALEARNQMPRRTGQMFKMFAGPVRTVTLTFPRTFLGAIYDRFGESIIVKVLPDDRAAVRVDVQISPTFWGWLFQFGGAIRLTDPQDLVAQARDLLTKMLEDLPPT